VILYSDKGQCHLAYNESTDASVRLVKKMEVWLLPFAITQTSTLVATYVMHAAQKPILLRTIPYCWL